MKLTSLHCCSIGLSYASTGQDQLLTVVHMCGLVNTPNAEMELIVVVMQVSYCNKAYIEGFSLYFEHPPTVLVTSSGGPLLMIEKKNES